MRFDWATFALQTVNFAILVWLLHRFLYKPVLRLLDVRRAEIDKHYAEAHATEAKAQSELAEVKAEHDTIAAERVAALQQAAVQAEERAAARRVMAERDAAALLAETRKTLAEERARALAEARRAALDLGADIAGRLLAEIPMKLRAEAWLERIEQYLTALPKSEFEAFARQLANGVPLKVVTASMLPADIADSWRSRLRTGLGEGIAIDFDVDPGLIAGAELRFPNAILRFSWQDALKAISAEIEPDGSAG